MAAELLPFPWREVLSVVERTSRMRPLAEGAVRAIAGGLAGHIELRTALIDAAVRDAVSTGLDQMVIVGAGLDGRAYRMPELSGVDVYEIDHPATQNWKKQRASGLQPTARSVHHVAADFERTSLGDVMTQTPHDPGRATLWVWEAVTMYLPHAAIAATLRDIAARSVDGSRLVATYLTPEVVVGGRLTGQLTSVAFPLFRHLSEPLIGMLAPQALHASLREHGFRELSDELPADAAIRFGRSPRRALINPAERVVVAVR